jgi:hypothetical protein
MSKGPGRLQRWLIANLPAHDSGCPVAAAELAIAYYATDKPTANQRTTVLRSIQSLNQRDLV